MISTRKILFSIDGLGRFMVVSVEYTVSLMMFFYISLKSAVLNRTQGLRSVASVIASQVYFTGWQAMPIISILALATGGIVILQASSQLSLFGGGQMIGQLIIMIIIREVAPLLTALIVIARSGTAVASEIGNMKVQKEIEALEVMGINPLSYLVFPRILGGMISMVCLSFYYCLIATVGGFLVTKLIHNMSFAFFTNSLAQFMSPVDGVLFLLKTAVGGILIFVVASYQGLQVIQGSHEVPQITTKAVMNSIVYVIVFNLIVTISFYINELKKMGVI